MADQVPPDNGEKNEKNEEQSSVNAQHNPHHDRRNRRENRGRGRRDAPRKEYQCPDLSKLTPSELEQKAQYYEDKIFEEKQKIRILIEDITKTQSNVENIRKDRDNLNLQVKGLISDAMKKKEERDEYHKKIAALKEERAKLEQYIAPHAHRISEMKKIRDKYNDFARGSAEVLKKKVEDSFKALMELDLSLKDETTLYEITMELSDRYYAKKNADKVHAEMQKYFDDNMRPTDEKLEAINNQIQELHVRAQALHEEAMAEFKKKDELRKESDKVHSRVIESAKGRSEVQAEIDAHREKIDEYSFLKECCLRELRRLEGLEQSKKRNAQLEVAKQKLERKGGKLGLEDLKVLLESGHLK